MRGSTPYKPDVGTYDNGVVLDGTAAIEAGMHVRACVQQRGGKTHRPRDEGHDPRAEHVEGQQGAPRRDVRYASLQEEDLIMSDDASGTPGKVIRCYGSGRKGV